MSERAEHVLDNPVWHALRGEQRAFGLVGRRAACYRADISPLAALADGGAEALLELASLVAPGRYVAVIPQGGDHRTLGDELAAVWRFAGEARVSQWVCREAAPMATDIECAELAAPHAQAMRRLARTTDPGPFELGTHRLGTYLGVFAADELVAMAGERVCVSALAGAAGYREVSAVCTAAAHRGRGYAQALVREIVRRQQRRGCVSFLHVRTGSPDAAGAIHVYEKIGFGKRMDTTMSILVRRRGE